MSGVSGPARRVIKIGGSCLSHAPALDGIRRWIQRTAGSQDFVIVGGGECVEAMRELSARWPLSETAMHWRCIGLLRANFEVVSELCPEWQAIGCEGRFRELVDAPPRVGAWLIAVDTFYNLSTSVESGLPIGWQTTTDSIAAYLARRIGAAEGVLMKSCATDLRTPHEWAQAGIVDAAFAEAAQVPFSLLECGDLSPL